MKEMYNCPNCGAPIGYSPKCEYCGTVLRWLPFESKTINLVVYPKDVIKVMSAIRVDPYEIRNLHMTEGQLRRQLAYEMVDHISSPEFMEIRREPRLTNFDTEYRGIIRLVRPKEGVVDL